MTTWFTADQHFNHKNLVTKGKRKFDSVEQMDDYMIDRWNRIVKPDDTVYQLGDFTLQKSPKIFQMYLDQLNGNVKFVTAGHDKWVRTYHYDAGIILPPLHTIKVKWPYDQDIVYITLCHYPMWSWERSHYGMPHFHGHTHGNIGMHSKAGNYPVIANIKDAGTRIDVGVDVWGFSPVDLDTLLRIVMK